MCEIPKEVKRKSLRTGDFSIAVTSVVIALIVVMALVALLQNIGVETK